MAVTVEKQTIYMGAGLQRTAWIVWDDETLVGWHADYVAAQLRVADLVEQKEHRDG
jgi:hypothetical protein|tara:strand:+ start:248 stop:415 length:168 start_codon:yes stop_codon:yes gene_type:complete